MAMRRKSFHAMFVIYLFVCLLPHGILCMFIICFLVLLVVVVALFFYIIYI